MVDLVRGSNSFADQGELNAAIQSVITAVELQNADQSDTDSALYNAYENLDQVTVEIILESQREPITRLGDLTSALIDEIESEQPRVYRKLLRAQMIEANFLLGGNPIEDRRRSGLLSDSSGESAQFFRTTKPLILPICREAAAELRGIISFTKSLGRS